MPPPRAQADRPDRGSVSIFLALASFAMILLVGLAVDLSGVVHAQQRARNVAAQAARTGGQHLQAGPAIRGQAALGDLTPAVAAAQDYLTASGVTGTATVEGGTSVVVTTTDLYTTKFLSIIGLDQVTVAGQASSRIVRAEAGTEQ